MDGATSRRDRDSHTVLIIRPSPCSYIGLFYSLSSLHIKQSAGHIDIAHQGGYHSDKIDIAPYAAAFNAGARR